MGRARLFVGSALFVFLAVGLLARHFLYMFTWPETDAIVTGTHVLEETSGPSGHPLYRSQVDVRYDLHGQAVRGHAVSTYWTSDRRKAEEKLADFTPGAHKKVRYDPSSPDELRFDAEASFEALQIPLLSAAVGVVLLVAGIFLGRRS